MFLQLRKDNLERLGCQICPANKWIGCLSWKTLKWINNRAGGIEEAREESVVKTSKD
jgi:hypothetical protein